jgi:hypothetical protein
MVSYSVIPVGEPDGVSVSGSLTIPGGNGSGTLQILVANTGNDPVIGISVMIPTGSDPTADLCIATCTMLVLFNGNPVSTTNALPVQSNAVGSIATNEGATNNTYTVVVNVTYADGTTPTGPSITLSPGTG